MSNENVIDEIIKKACRELNNNVVLAIPLGIGKPNVFVNRLYQYIKRHPEIKLTICTALTLQKPAGKHWLEERFIDLFKKRVFGNYPDLLYEIDRVNNQLPKNIEVIEFYFPPGKFMSNKKAQQNYISSNYTHVCRDLVDRGVNLIAMLVSEEDGLFSYSSNADVSKDIIKTLKVSGLNYRVVVEVNRNLPFMYGEAIVDDKIDYVIDTPQTQFDIFSPPKLAVSHQDFMIGLYASLLVKDDGELQVGIGSLGDAVVYGLVLKHKENQFYREIFRKLNADIKFKNIIERIGSFRPFKVGLFGATEMMVDGFMELYQAGILKKKVYDDINLQRLINEGKIDPEQLKLDDLYILEKARIIQFPLNQKEFEYLQKWGFLLDNLTYEEERNYIRESCIGKKLKNGHLMHAGFFLGPNRFYNWLKNLPKEERKLFDMRSVLKINQLYGHEEIDRLHRRNARFVNTCMMTTLSGAHVSDGLANLKVVSGVGGQFNFVAMAQELPDGHSIIMMRATRFENGKLVSNIVESYGHITVPRHMRDILVTEYGIAWLRGRTDREIVIELLKVCDSHFQDELLMKAKVLGKIEEDYKIPDEFKQNYSTHYEELFFKYKQNGFFNAFPFGTDLSEEEIKLGKALKKLAALKKLGKHKLFTLIFKSLLCSLKNQNRAYLKLINIERPKSLSEFIFARLINYLLD